MKRDESDLLIREHLAVVDLVEYAVDLVFVIGCEHRMEESLVVEKIFGEGHFFFCHQFGRELYPGKDRPRIHVDSVIYLHQLFDLTESHPLVARKDFDLFILTDHYHDVPVALAEESRGLLRLDLIDQDRMIRRVLEPVKISRRSSAVLLREVALRGLDSR